MKQVMMSPQETAALITQGKRLLLAGDDALLSQLPRGQWVGGSIPYFIGDQGGVCTRQKILVDEVPSEVVDVRLVTYAAQTLERAYKDAQPHGFSFIVLPSGCPTQLAFAMNAPSYPGFGAVPLVGWVAGIHLEDAGRKQAAVFNGATGERITDGAVVLHARLRPGRVADLGIVNIFKPGAGEAITFLEPGFSASEVLVGGKRVNLARHVTQLGLDTRLPLVADYFGASINVSFQAVDAAKGTVQFYAPVFPGVEYRHAAAVGDYVQDFVSAMPADANAIRFSCNCILNYLHSGLEGKRTGDITGPVTFGEIAYQLLNQTMVYLRLEDGAAEG